VPAEPGLLSFVVAAAMVVDLPEHQALLAEPGTIRRLAAERALLSREVAMLLAHHVAARPGPEALALQPELNRWRARSDG